VCDVTIVIMQVENAVVLFRDCVYFSCMCFRLLIWPTLLYAYYIVTLYMCFIGLYLISSPQESTARRSVAQTVDSEIKV
jgi:hypothetical protein